MTASNLNLTIEQGATFSQVVAVGEAYNGLSPRGTIRRSFGGDSLASLTCSAVAAGNTTISLTAAQTAALQPLSALPSERDVVIGVWDLETPTADATPVVTRHRQGKVILSREAST
jgi:hypothetical protein